MYRMLISERRWNGMNKVVHFEIPADDMDRAKKFYSEVFGWQTSDYEGSVMVTTGPVDEKGMPKDPAYINGDLYKRTDKNPHPSVVMLVDSIDEHLQKIEAAGGKTVSPKEEIKGMGFYAAFKDSEGNVLGIWENPKEM